MLEALLNSLFKLMGMTEHQKAEVRALIDNAPEMVRDIVTSVQRADERLARIEAKLGILDQQKEDENDDLEINPIRAVEYRPVGSIRKIEGGS